MVLVNTNTNSIKYLNLWLQYHLPNLMSLLASNKQLIWTSMPGSTSYQLHKLLLRIVLLKMSADLLCGFSFVLLVLSNCIVYHLYTNSDSEE